MKDSCGVDMSKTSRNMSNSLLVTTSPLDHAHHRVKLLNMNSTQVLAIVVVLISVIVLVDRYEQKKRIGQLERKQEDQEALIRELQEGLRNLRDIVKEGGNQTSRYDTTEAEEQLQKTRTLSERESQSYSVTRRNQATVRDDKRKKQLSNKRRGDVKEDEYLKRFKRPAADPHSSGGSSQGNPARQKRGSKKGKRKNEKRCRQVNSTCAAPTCEFVNECNSIAGISGPIIAHFIPPQDPENNFINATNNVIGNWEHASWTSELPGWTLDEHRHHKLRIKSRVDGFPDRPRRSTIEVKETGIYYIYSQVTFADESSYLGHSILIDDEIKFTCSLWVTEVQANTCRTGGLIKIEADQLVHIELIQRNRIINMDHANTFFGIMQMMTI